MNRGQFIGRVAGAGALYAMGGGLPGNDFRPSLLMKSSDSSSRKWTCALELDRNRSPRSGSADDLARAIRRGADLRIYTEFIYEEHIGSYGSPATQAAANHGLMKEVIDFRVAYLLAPGHVAGITTLRQPVEPLTGFNGLQPKMSFFLYNADGHQACANLVLDGAPTAPPGNCAVEPTPARMPKMSPQDTFDVGSSGPSRNFIYQMERYRYFVRDDWTELCAHDRDGRIRRGSFAAIEQAQDEGREIKVAFTGLCADLGEGPEHEVFSLAGSTYLHTARKTYETLAHPLVRVAPGIPLEYGSRKWDVTWVYMRTDGCAVLRILDPYTRQFRDRATRLACRWFAR